MSHSAEEVRQLLLPGQCYSLLVTFAAVAVTCESLVDPVNGKVSVSGLSVGAFATYTCNSGFLLVGGAKSRVCSLGGVWSGVAPVCRSKSSYGM